MKLWQYKAAAVFVFLAIMFSYGLLASGLFIFTETKLANAVRGDARFCEICWGMVQVLGPGCLIAAGVFFGLHGAAYLVRLGHDTLDRRV